MNRPEDPSTLYKRSLPYNQYSQDEKITQANLEDLGCCMTCMHIVSQNNFMNFLENVCQTTNLSPRIHRVFGSCRMVFEG